MSTPIKIGLAVLAGAAAISIPIFYRISCSVEPARHLAISQDVRGITTALQAYKQQRGEYPTTLQALVEHHQLNALPTDPSKRDYIYRFPGIKDPHGFDLFSAGRDGIPNTADDDWGGDL